MTRSHIFDTPSASEVIAAFIVNGELRNVTVTDAALNAQLIQAVGAMAAAKTKAATARAATALAAVHDAIFTAAEALVATAQ